MEHSKHTTSTTIHQVCILMAWGTLLLGLSVLIGWQLDIELLLRPMPGLVAMNPTTALCFVLCAAGILGAKKAYAKWLAWGVLVLCGLILLLWLLKSSFALDHVLFASKLDLDQQRGVNNRLAPNTALAFLFSSAAMLALPHSRKGRLPELLTMLVLMLGTISLVGYGYRVPEFYGVLKAFPMAVHTAMGFVLLAGSLLLHGTHGPLMRVLRSAGTGGMLARWLMPIAIVTPIVLGALRLYGERQGFYSSSFGLMLYVVVVIIIFINIILRVATDANKHDKVLRQHATELQQLNAILEDKVKDRTKVLELKLKELKETSEKLAASEERFRYTLDNMMEGVQIIDPDFKYKYLNNAVLEQGKRSYDQMIGKTMMACYPGIEQTDLFKLVSLCLRKKEGTDYRVENQFSYPDGTSAWFDLRVQRVPEGVFILSIDITERKKAEEDLNRLNKTLEQKVAQRTAQLEATNKELEAFSYSVSHDLRAPLRAINGFSEMVEKQYAEKLDANGNRLLGVIKSNAITMGKLIDDLLEFSRTGRKEVRHTVVDMTAVVQDCVHNLEVEYGSAHKVDVGVLPKANCDSQLITHVWTNLLSNAFKYSAKKEKPHIKVWAEEQEEEIVLHVQDNGAGFNMQYADKLFGVFQRLHSTKEFEGTGVGLAIVNRIVTKHGGRIWAEAEENKGATFHFALPKTSKTGNHE